MFSRHAREEVEQKGYGRSFRKRQVGVMVDMLIQHTLQEAYASTLPVLRLFTGSQHGETFGERFANAIESGFEAGFERLIICGTDTPDLTSEQFLSVAAKLNTHQLILGPSADGGVYLIGIHRQAYNRKSFLEIPWLTARVCDALVAYAHKSTCTVTLEQTTHDIDDGRAIWNWFGNTKPNWFSALLCSILESSKNRMPVLLQQVYIDTSPSLSFSRRGPPNVH